MPMIMASAVIRTGRKRVKPASRAAAAASRPRAKPSRAKLTSRMLFAVAMPMHMMAPVRAGTDSVVPVMNSIQTMPASAAGQRGNDDERVEPGLEVDDDHEVDEDDGAGKAEIKLAVGAVIVWTWPRNSDKGSARHVFFAFRCRMRLMSRGDRAEIAPLGGAVDVDDRLDIVMRHNARARPWRDPAPGRPDTEGRFMFTVVIGTFWRSAIVSMRYCGIWATIG